MILWVDDDTMSALDSFIDDITDGGWDISLAQNPDEMWKILESSEKPINCIIMDIMLPTGESIDPIASKMGITSGLELIKQLKNNEKYYNIPIIIFTIVDDPELSKYADDCEIPILKKQDVFQEDLIEEIKNLKIKKDRS